MPAAEITIAPPPRTPRTASHGWPLLLPLLSGAGSLPLLLGSPASGRRWLLLGTAASLLASTAAGLGMRLLARRASERTRRRDRARYLAHLHEVAAAVARVAALQRSAAEYLHPDVAALPRMIEAADRVWERSPADGDFLEVRLGRGQVGLAAPLLLDLGRDPTADHDPELLAMARELARRCSRLDGLPVAVSLRQLGVLTVHGQPEAARSLTRSLVLRSAAFHAPCDLRVLAVFPPDAAPAWDWLKWLPHAREEGADEPGAHSPAAGRVEPPACLLAATPGRAAELLERQIAPRLARLRTGPLAAPVASSAEEAAPGGGAAHLLVIVDGYVPHGPVGRLPVLDGLLRSAPALEVTAVCLVGRAADEPSATRLRVELDDRGGLVMTDVTEGGCELGGVRPDQVDVAMSEAIARRLAPLWIDHPTGPPTGHRGPRPQRLLDVLGLATPEAIDPTACWRPRPASDLLRVPIGHPTGGPARPAAAGAGRLRLLEPHIRQPAGVQGGASAGLPVILDLKEAADGGMGPHGLLVGATGSGKSELLRTIVTGLALTHAPELLSFVLVDFKGGAAFAGLAKLPHTAGLITNLASDSAMVDRARTALRGEQERRQRLLRDAGDLDSIAGYQRLRSMDQRLEPLPRLLVVVDEFGELLGAHPEFLDLLTAIGRTGRSLGIHLLLASQRMEEGRLRGLDSHLRYRICLRTSSAADSAAVLGAPDAYHLPPSPGNGLLGVDGGPCQRFKGLLVSTSKVGPPDPGGARGPSPALVLPFDPIAGPAAHPPVDGAPSLPRAATVLGEWSACRPPAGTVPDRGSLDGAGPTDLDVVVSALAPLARAGRRSHPIWLPPLPATITLGEVVQSAGEWPGPGDPAWLRVPVGTVDRPFDQCQEPLMLDFTGGLGHLAIAGAPRSGKSTLLATLVAAFALTHRPDSAQFYCVDLGGGLLHELACLPHVGAVLGLHEPTEVRRLVRALHSLVTTRERSFRRHGISSMAAWHARRDTDRALAQDGYGEVFLMVDNWSRLRQELEDLEPEIEGLAGAGLHYGVHLVVAANRWADLRLALRDNVGGRLELRLNDPIESEVGRAAAARLPELPGRGLTPEGHQFQVALPVLGTGERDHHLASGPARAPGAARPTRPPPIAVREIARRAVRSPTGAKAPPHLPLPALLPVEDLSQRAAVPVEAASRTAAVRVEDLFASAPGPATGAGRAVGIPFALHEHRLEVVRLDLATAPHFLVLGDAESGRTATLRCLARGLMACHPPGELRLLVVDYRRTLMDLMDAPHCESYASAPSMAAEVAARLRALLDRRLPGSAVRRTEARRWSGPRFVMVVDDYDLVADAGPNPLGPLLDLLGQGRDIGLHVLLARPVSGAARSSFEPFYQRVRETGSPGLILSGDPREGPLLGGRAAAAQPPGRGYLVTRQGRSGLVQVAWTPPGPPTGPGALPGSTPPPHQVPPPTPPAPSAAGAMDDPVWSGSP